MAEVTERIADLHRAAQAERLARRVRRLGTCRSGRVGARSERRPQTSAFIAQVKALAWRLAVAIASSATS